MFLAALGFVVIASCHDGDTCTTTTGERVRLACIDTPELRGKGAEPRPAIAARDYLRGLVVGKKLGVRRITKDRYGRTMADVFLGTTNVQQEMVASGHREPLGSTPINFFGQKIGKGTKALPLVKADLMTHIALRE